MNPRNVINFFRTPTGVFIGFVVLMVIALAFAKGCRKPDQANETKKPNPTASVATQSKPQVIESIKKAIQPFSPPVAKPPPEQPQPVEAPKKEKPREVQELAPISLFGDTRVTEPKPLSKHYAPFGRLIPCELIITIDSSSIRTPIVGLVTENIHHAGRLIIPAGTEVHGTTQLDRMRERIASADEWTLVWQTGEELSLKALALDRERNPDGEGWGITDGSAGLRGRLIKSDSLAEIKLFAATFLSGAAGSLTEREQTVFGSQALPSLQNAPFRGVQDVLTAYAKQILDSIQRDGFYVRVPAGKEFYLYVIQTIDRNDAAIGGTRFEEEQKNQVVSASAPRAVAKRPEAQIEKP